MDWFVVGGNVTPGLEPEDSALDFFPIALKFGQPSRAAEMHVNF